jgi:hypothetical protein
MVENKSPYKNQMPVIADDLIGLSSSTDFSKMTEKMYSEDQIKMTTDLSPKSIYKLNLLYAMADEYDLPMLRQMCDTFIQLRVSNERKGRTEAVSMAQAILGMKKLDAMERMIESGGGKK